MIVPVVELKEIITLMTTSNNDVYNILDYESFSKIKKQ